MYSMAVFCGVGIIAAVTALATTLFSPYNNVHNPFFKSFIAEPSPQCWGWQRESIWYTQNMVGLYTLVEKSSFILLCTDTCFWKLSPPNRNLQKFYAMLCTAQHGLHTYNLPPMPLYLGRLWICRAACDYRTAAYGLRGLNFAGV